MISPNSSQQYTQQLSEKALIIYKKCKTQHNSFIEWAIHKKWNLFHDLHYEWWAFPNNQPSVAFGNQYKLEQDDVIILRKNEEFIKIISTNACLVCQSWNWNLQSGYYYNNQLNNTQQKWNNSVITLHRMCLCLKLFSIQKLFDNAIKFAMKLMQKWCRFTFAGTDCSQYFMQYFYEMKVKCKYQKQNKDVKQYTGYKQSGLVIEQSKQITLQVLQRALSLKFTMKQKQLEQQVLKVLEKYEISRQDLRKFSINPVEETNPYIAIYLPKQQLNNWQIKNLVIAAALFPYDLQPYFRDNYLQSTCKRIPIQLFFAFVLRPPESSNLFEIIYRTIHSRLGNQ